MRSILLLKLYIILLKYLKKISRYHVTLILIFVVMKLMNLWKDIAENPHQYHLVRVEIIQLVEFFFIKNQYFIIIFLVISEEGYYILCNGKLLKKETDKCILSKFLKVDKPSVIEFWYFMHGFQIGTLELVINRSDLLWSLSGKQKNEWILAKVELPSGEYVVK
jgi:hypothetical protein